MNAGNGLFTEVNQRDGLTTVAECSSCLSSAGDTGYRLEPLPVAPAALEVLAEARRAQVRWANAGIRQRLRVLRRARGLMVARAEELARTVPLELAGSTHRSLADTLAAEVLPLVEALRFLEREAEPILAPRHAHEGGGPFWLGRVSVEVRREPLGVTLVLAPGNYPLFLAGAQALQALAAGNAVLWKPSAGGAAAAIALRRILVEAGLDPMLLQVLEDTVEAGRDAIDAGVDKVFLTGSAETGRAVLGQLAESLTPAVMELSGCDAVFVIKGADLDRVVAAVAFGLRLNGSATCMAPRRLFASAEIAAALRDKLAASLKVSAPIPVTAGIASALRVMTAEAMRDGAVPVCGGIEDGGVRTLLLDAVKPWMRIARTDIAAPVLSMIVVEDEDEAVEAYTECSFRLTVSIFGSERRARRLAGRLSAGVVTVNDIIVSTADPRAAFGGRGESGFGVTRGREGLLEMTALKTVLVQRSRSLRAYEPAVKSHVGLFLGYLKAVHGGGFRQRWSGLLELAKALVRIGRTG